MEFTRLTDKKRKAITLEILNRTSFLKLAERNELDHDSHRSMVYVQHFLETPESELADDILATFGTIKDTFNTAIQGTYPYMAKYQVLWGRIYIWLYFFKHDDTLWNEYLFPLMLNGRVAATILEDIKMAMERMDNYLSRQARIDSYISKRHELHAQPACDSTVETPDAESEPLLGNTKTPGRPKQNLFVNLSYEQQAKEQLTNYLKQHKLSSRTIKGSKDDTLNKTIACFCWRWKELGHISDLSAAALYRFMYDTCHIEFEITEKTFTNKMGEILRNPRSFDGLMGDIRAYIQK